MSDRMGIYNPTPEMDRYMYAQGILLTSLLLYAK